MRRAAIALALAAACGRVDPPAGPGIPGAPLPPPRGKPTGLSVSGAIDAAGGSLSFTASAGSLLLTVPAGALASSVTFTISEIVPAGLLGGVGSGYQIDPAGTPLAMPVTLIFTPPGGTPPAGLTAAYQAAVGYWFRVYAATRDATTVLTQTTDLMAWSLVTMATQRDLKGAFTLASTEDLPFSASGNVMLQFLGDDGTTSAYLPQGTITLSTPVAKGSASCSTASASLTLPDSVARLTSTRFDWGINGQWQLSCSDGSSDFVSTDFDTLGITNLGCARSYSGPYTISAALVQGTYLIDCGAGGTVTASWNLAVP